MKMFKKKINKIIYFLKYIIIFFGLLIFKCLINIRYKSSSISNRNLKNNQSQKINFIKRNIYNIIKNKTCINTLYIKGYLRFGNYLISLNNAIIFCEFSGCKRIIINNDFFKHNIFYQQYNITIESNYSSNYIENDSMIFEIRFFFFFFKIAFQI